MAIHTVQGGTTAVSAPALEAKGYLGPSFLICHFLAATKADRQAMARTGTPLSFAVHSELRLGEAGDPRAALLRMLAAGVRVSLSIDAASLAPVNLFEAMNVAWNLGIPWQDSDTKDLDALTFRRCIEMATIDGARALGGGCGGHRLDHTAQACRHHHDPCRRPQRRARGGPGVDHRAVGDPANVDTVLVDGRILSRHGELVAFDVDRVVRDAEQASQAVRARAGGRLQPAS